jgi:hypothetical protein
MDGNAFNIGFFAGDGEFQVVTFIGATGGTTYGYDQDQWDQFDVGSDQNNTIGPDGTIYSPYSSNEGTVMTFTMPGVAFMSGPTFNSVPQGAGVSISTGNAPSDNCMAVTCPPNPRVCEYEFIS